MHSPSNGEGLSNIQHNTHKVSFLIHYNTLLQYATAILSQFAAEVYYKMRQVFYYKM